jgi:hypothetical protein
MKAKSKAISLLAVAAALTLSGGYVFAKGGGGGGGFGGSHPTQVKASGTSAVPSGAGGNRSRYVPYCKLHPGRGGCPAKVQPTCRGPHMGPNGVMIQCE